MASKSTLTYSDRAQRAKNPLVRKLFDIAERKKSNIVVSADLTTTDELLTTADRLGPHIAVFKTHIDIVSDFSYDTVARLKELADKHDFLIFEDRKFIDIGNTVQMQYHGGALKISDWAHVVNASVLAGPGIVQALAATATGSGFPYHGDRGLLILAEMTTKGSLAVGEYTKSSVQIARQFKDFVFGFVATKALSDIAGELEMDVDQDEDFVVFTTGVNRSTAGDKLGQQYQTPEQAIRGGADFIISGRGIYAADDPVASVKAYKQEGWAAYEARTRH